MVDKIEDIKEGDLVELTLKPDATTILGAYVFFVKDKMNSINIPGRSYVGYVIRMNSQEIALAHGWNKINGKYIISAEGDVYRFEIIDSCSKLVPIKKEHILSEYPPASL